VKTHVRAKRTARAEFYGRWSRTNSRGSSKNTARRTNARVRTGGSVTFYRRRENTERPPRSLRKPQDRRRGRAVYFTGNAGDVCPFRAKTRKMTAGCANDYRRTQRNALINTSHRSARNRRITYFDADRRTRPHRRTTIFLSARERFPVLLFARRYHV